MTVLELPTPDPRALDESARPFAEAVSGRFAVKRLIGTGGMGMVYLAREKRLDRLVALKTLPPQLANDTVVRERFLRETRTAGGLTHPNIVGMHGADEVDGHVYFVMTYVKGASLATQVAAHGRLNPDTVARYLRDVASALVHAHARGIVHRDIKAENILIDDESGKALVSDFGIARLAEASPLTVTGQVLGSVYYVSPEQVSGGDVDARTDIYSLGVVGYLALTGRFPFNAELASAVMLQHVTHAAAPVASRQSDVPPALAAIVDRCLSKNPTHRFATAGDLLAALEATGLGDGGASGSGGYTAAPGMPVSSSANQTTAPAERVTPSATPGAPAGSGGSASAPVRVSDNEAQQLWQRAAELQAATGLHPRPAAVPRPRDVVSDSARRSGFGLSDVREAAVDAGIGEEYIEHAMAEHGLLTRDDPAAPRGAVRTVREPMEVSPSVVFPVEPIAPRLSWWARVPTRTVQELHVEGTLPAGELDRLVEIARMSTGKMGETFARTHELVWRAGRLGAQLQVNIVPQAEHTTVRVVRDLRRSIYLRAATALAVSALVVLPTVISLLIEMSSDEEAAVWTGFAVGSLALWRGGKRLIKRGHTKWVNRTARVAERLAAGVSDAVKRGR